MSQSSEQIEAKLCAYLEGELDEQGRAEIEKHLAANPAHRKLLAEVAGTRDLLRGLPREAAPADLCETLQGHLERSVLLDNAPDAHAHHAMRIGRWRPMLAMAAMVVLAVGLGLVIYFGLPGAVQHQGSVNYAKNTKGPGTAPDEPPEGRGATQPAETGRNEKDRAIDAEQQLTETLPGQGKAQASSQAGQQYARGGSFGGGMGGATRAMQPTASAGLAPTTGEAERLNAVAQGTESKVSTDSLQELAQQVPKLWSPEQQRALFYSTRRAGGAAGPANPALYLVVASAEPAATSQQVTEELARLDVKFETVAVPVTEESATESSTPGKKGLSDSAYALSAGGAGGGFGSGTELNALKKANQMQRPAPERVPAERNALAGVAGRDAAADRFSASETRSPAGASGGATPPSAPAATSPAAAGRLAERAEDPLAADKVAAADAAPAAPAAAPAAEPGTAPADAGARSETLYVARNVTRRQAELLRASLGQNRGEGEVALWSAQPDGSVAPASVLQPELSVAETKSDTDAAAAVPSTNPSSVAEKPALRERVALRSAREEIGEVRAQSDTQDQAGRQRYSESGPSGGRGARPTRGLATAPPVTKQADLTRAARQTGVNEAQARQDEKLTTATTAAPAPATTPAPSKLGVAQSGPATSPDTAAEAEDERVDLVILVRKPDAAGSAGAAGGPIEKHEILTVTLGDDDSTNVRVAEDGTVDLPTVGKVPAEGLTAEELGKKLTMSLGRAKVGAKVTVTRPGAPGASTRPETQAAEDSPKPDDAAPAPDVNAEKAPQRANKSDSGGQ